MPKTDGLVIVTRRRTASTRTAWKLHSTFELMENDFPPDKGLCTHWQRCAKVHSPRSDLRNRSDDLQEFEWLRETQPLYQILHPSIEQSISMVHTALMWRLSSLRLGLGWLSV
jgi:hypothetical protein